MVRIAGGRSTGARATSGDPGPASPRDQESLGDLVALAARDVSQLIRYEINLAKSELKADARRAAMAGGLFVFAAFIGCLVLVLLAFALAYGLWAAGAGGLWLCFIYAAITCVLVAGILVVAAIFGTKRFSGMRQTRKTVTEDLGMLRRRDADGISGGSKSGVSAGSKSGVNGTAAVSPGAAGNEPDALPGTASAGS